MKKILIHNMTFNGIHTVSGVINYDQRGMVFADSGDTIVTQNPIDQVYLAYLEKLGYPINKINYLSNENEESKSWNSIFDSPKVLNYLNKITNKKDHLIDVYIPTEFDGKLSETTKIAHCSNYKLCQEYGTKSGFKTFAKGAELPFAESFENLKTTNEVKKAMEDLFQKGFKRVVVKVDDGISGYGNWVVELELFNQIKNLPEDEFYEKYLKKIRWDIVKKGIVEGWIENVINSLSILVFVKEGKGEVFCLQDQLLVDGDKWAGCYFPSTLEKKKKVFDNLQRYIAQATSFLVKNGFWGYYSFDVVENADERLYFIEANMRKIGSFYPRVLVNKVLSDSNSKYAYVSSDYVNPGLWKGRKVQDVLTKLKDILWPIKNSNNGVLIYNTGAIEDAGRFDFVTLSDNLDDAKKLRLFTIETLNS